MSMRQSHVICWVCYGLWSMVYLSCYKSDLTTNYFPKPGSLPSPSVTTHGHREWNMIIQNPSHPILTQLTVTIKYPPLAANLLSRGWASGTLGLGQGADKSVPGRHVLSDCQMLGIINKYWLERNWDNLLSLFTEFPPIRRSPCSGASCINVV